MLRVAVLHREMTTARPTGSVPQRANSPSPKPQGHRSKGGEAHIPIALDQLPPPTIVFQVGRPLCRGPAGSSVTLSLRGPYHVTVRIDIHYRLIPGSGEEKSSCSWFAVQAIAANNLPQARQNELLRPCMLHTACELCMGRWPWILAGSRHCKLEVPPQGRTRNPGSCLTVFPRSLVGWELDV